MPAGNPRQWRVDRSDSTQRERSAFQASFLALIEYNTNLELKDYANLVFRRAHLPRASPSLRGRPAACLGFSLLTLRRSPPDRLQQRYQLHRGGRAQFFTYLMLQAQKLDSNTGQA